MLTKSVKTTVKILISKISKGKFKFDLIDRNDVIVLSSQEYTRKRSALKGAKSVMDNSNDPLKYVILKDYFILRAGNNREIGRSPQMPPDQLEAAIELLQAHGSDAPITYA